MAADYEPTSAETTRFFQTIQNKLHYAATGMTAPELIRSRADHKAPNMGLTSWKSGEVRKGDVTIAKNYLAESEIGELNRIAASESPELAGHSPSRSPQRQHRMGCANPPDAIQCRQAHPSRTRGMANIFISYSHRDEPWKEPVARQLGVLAPAGLDAWDDRRIAAGDAWEAEIAAAIAGCDCALLLISADFLTSRFILDSEVPALLERQREHGIRIIPLIVKPCAWSQVPWLRALQSRPKDGTPLSGMDQHQVDEALAALTKEIAELLDQQPRQGPGPRPPAPPLVDLDHLPLLRNEHFLGRGPELAALDRAWTSGQATSVVTLIAPGGTGKTALIKRWLDRLRTGQSGSGSGSGSESVSTSTPKATTPWQGATQILGWSFYSQGTSEDRQASEDLFLAVAIERLQIEIDPAANPADKGRALAERLIDTRTLLILDGLEPLQYPPGPLAGQLRAPGLRAMLCGIAAAGHPGLCVVTSRERLQDLAEWLRTPAHPAGGVLRIDLENLNEADGAALLHAAGADRAGTAAIHPDDPELRAAASAVRGHALTLSLLGGYLHLAQGGDIRRRDQVPFQEADAETGAGHVARVLGAYEHWLARDAAPELAALRLFGLFDRPAAPALLDALRAPPAIPGLTEPLTGTAGFQPARAPKTAGALGLPRRLWHTLRRRPPPADAEPAKSRRSPDAQWRIALTRLEELRLIAPPAADGSRDAHPLIREHLGAMLRERAPAAWRAGHDRIFERLKTDTPQRPDGLAGLQPLYQAVAHGCQAGRWEEARAEVYRDRILRGTGPDGFYSSRRLGAFGADLSALAHLFAEPWRRPVPALSASDRAWLLNQAGVCLRALGRLAEALEPMRAGAEMYVEQQGWKAAAIGFGNLSELQLALGRIDAAVADARRAVDHADRSGDAFQRMAMRTTLADALHQQGEAAAANAAFAEAEAMQAERQPQYPQLYSLWGFRYCDLLLAAAERAAWSGPGAGPRAGGGAGSAGDDGAGTRDGAGAGAQGGHGAGLVADCAEVARRAGQTLQIAEAQLGLLDIALDHLTLARCALYADRLQGRPPGPEARDRAERALDRLRAAGTQDHLPRGLLTRARLRHALGDPAGADADLREAERIAERGAMALHQADCALTRARLFQDPAALARARRLIEQHGYRRRLPELEDAEAALGAPTSVGSPSAPRPPRPTTERDAEP